MRTFLASLGMLTLAACFWAPQECVGACGDAGTGNPSDGGFTLGQLNSLESARYHSGLASCATPEQGLLNVSTEAELAQQITGIWATCTGSLLPPMPNEVGVEFAANNDWHILTMENGVLTRQLGFTGSGRWYLVSATQVNIELNGGGTVIVSPRFAQTPRKVTMSNNGVYSGIWASSP